VSVNAENGESVGRVKGGHSSFASRMCTLYFYTRESE
jgi:hypothetical protein